MKQKRDIILLTFLVTAFVAIAGSLFLPRLPLVPLFSLFLFVSLAVQSLGKAPVSFMMTGFSTLFGVFCISSVPEEQKIIIPLLIVILWVGSFLLHLHLERLQVMNQNALRGREDAGKASRVMKQEISFYEGRMTDLLGRAARRRQLSVAARELGALLDPHQIQDKLVQTAESIFPGRPAAISFGQQPDPVDQYIIQKKQPVLVPNNMMKGAPLVAAPITVQRSVAGILRVGGNPGKEFTRDDLRLLDILASLASLALDNAVLFTS